MQASRILVPALLFLASSHSPAAAEGAAGLWEAWYSVSARVHSYRLDADLEAGGRLEMAGRTDASGALVLSLDEVVEAPWKLYRVDPLGPFGGELKVASVVTLAEASWEALEAALAESETRGVARHRIWLETAERPRSLDGAFAFVVIGPARNRFRVEVDPGGPVARVTNRLTDRWLPGPFDRFIGHWGSWGREGREGDLPPSGAEAPPEGYWFWNRGESEPFSYEPHTYHAFAAALELLSLPLPVAPGDARVGAESMRWEDVGRRAVRVLSILAPRLDAGAFDGELAAPEALTATWETLPAGGTRLDLRSPAEPAQPLVERQIVFSSEGRPVGDRLRVRVTTRQGASLEVEAGYAPLNAR